MNFAKKLSLAAPAAVLIVLGTASLAPTRAATVSLTIPPSSTVPSGASIDANSPSVGGGQASGGQQSVSLPPLYPTTLNGQTGTTFISFSPLAAPASVPEPSAVYGIAAFGVIGAVFSFKRQRQMKRG